MLFIVFSGSKHEDEMKAFVSRETKGRRVRLCVCVGVGRQEDRHPASDFGEYLKDTDSD